MPSRINSTTTSPGGLIQTGDSDNSLLIQTGDTTAITVNSSQVVSLTNPLPVGSGGTGATSNSAAPFALKGANSDITSLSGLTTALSVGQGGTGSTSLTANNVLLGNGTSAVQVVAPGTSGNVLTSNGTTWTSATPQAVPESNNDQMFTSSGTFNVPAGVSRVKVTVIGAGGNGGNSSGASFCTNAPGGGAGAGGYVVDYIAVTPGGTATVTVGTNAGTRTSSFAGGTTLTAAGGSNGNNASGVTNGTLGVSGASTIFGQTNYSLGPSRQSDVEFNYGSSFILSGTSFSSQGSVYGHGFGVSGTLRSNSAGSLNVHTALGFGAGGGAGSNGAGTNRGVGGIGTNGLVIVEW